MILKIKENGDENGVVIWNKNDRETEKVEDFLGDLIEKLTNKLLMKKLTFVEDLGLVEQV